MQKELEKLDYYFVRFNPDKPGFDDYKEFGRVSAYIPESIKKQTKKSLWSFKTFARVRIQIKSLNKIKVFKMGCQKHFTKLQ